MINYNKIYYNTEYRKKIKALSRLNIYIKDRITKKDIIHEKRIEKKIYKKVPLFYKKSFKYYNLISNMYNNSIYKRKYDLKIILQFLTVKSFLKKKKLYIVFFNQLVLEYYINSIFYLFLIINWLWVNEWNKWASFTDILEHNFFSLNILLNYISNNFTAYCFFIIKTFDNASVLCDLIYNMNFINNNISVFNIYAFNEMKRFYVILNAEHIRYEHEKRLTDPINWKKIRKVSFSYFSIDLLNKIAFNNFFSFCIYEFNIIYNICNYQYIILTFFDYWIDIIIERNYKKYKQNPKKFEFNNYNLKNIYKKIIKNKHFKLRVKYNLFLSNIDYFFFLKNFTYNFYVRSLPYFFNFSSQRKLFITYMNAASLNKGVLSMWEFNQLFNRGLFFIKKTNINDILNLWDLDRFEPFFNFFNNKDKENTRFIFNSFFRDFNIKVLYKLKKVDQFYYSINKFFDFNLIDFYNRKNRYDCYKDVMKIESVYQYRFANSSFMTMDEFMISIFKTPLENYIYFDKIYKNYSFNILIEIYRKIERNFFFFDLINIDNISRVKNYSSFLKNFSRVFKIKIFTYKFNFLWNLIPHEENERLLKVDIFSEFYDLFEKKKFFFLIKKFNQKNFYKKWSIKKNLNILKYNSMFYLHYYNLYLLLNGWFFEIIFFYRFMNFVKIYNYLLNIYNYYDNYKYLISLKDFFFQLIYENIEYNLLFMLIFLKKINNKYSYNYINEKHKIDNNFIYRRYFLYTWLEFNYYDDLFDDLEFFEKENYSVKLSKWILRYFYEKSELYNFYSESLNNNYINKNRLLL